MPDDWTLGIGSVFDRVLGDRAKVAAGTWTGSGASGLRSGDVVFTSANVTTFAELDPVDFGDDFARVAAFSQAFPYVQAARVRGAAAADHDESPEVFKPWFHVSVVIEPGDAETEPTVLGFEDEIYLDEGSGVGTASAQAPLAERTLPRADSQGRPFRLVALRPPDHFDTTAMAMELDRQANAGIDYSVLGLVAFALATKGRILPPGPLRSRILDTAYGASALAAEVMPGTDSCVTAVARAVDAGMEEHLRFAEPPVNVAGEADRLPGRPGIPSELAEIDTLLDILVGGRAAPELATSSGSDRPVAAAAQMLRTSGLAHSHVEPFARWLGVPYSPDWDLTKGMPFGPGAIYSFEAYIQLLELAVDALVGAAYSLDAIRARGRHRRTTGTAEPGDGPVLGPQELLTSPAMLWDRLIDAGFDQVAVN